MINDFLGKIKRNKRLMYGIATVILILVGGAVATLIVSNFDKIPSALIFLVGLMVVVLLGVGDGLYALSEAVHLKQKRFFCYIPILQDDILFTLVRGLRTEKLTEDTSSIKAFQINLNNKIKNHNLPWLSGVLLIVSILIFLIPVPIVNFINTFFFLFAVIFHYFVRRIYMHFLLKRIYNSPLVSLLQWIPGVHAFLVAYMQKRIKKLTRKRN